MAARVGAQREQTYQRWLSGVGLLVLPFAIVVLVMAAQFRGLDSEAAIEQAVTARRWSAGEGFTTSVIMPRSLAFNDSLTAHPELRHGPLAVLPGMLLVKALGEPDNLGRTFAFSSMLAWLVAVWLLYFAGRLLVSHRVGLLALAFASLAPAGLQLAISGDGRAWAMPLLLLLWAVLAWPLSALARGAAAGALMGLIALTHYELTLPLLLAVLPVLAVTWRRGDAAAAPAEREATDDSALLERGAANWLALAVALGVMLLVVAPWLVRNQRVAGTPLPGLNSYSIMWQTEAVPGRSIERRYLDPGASHLGFAWNHKRQLVRKTFSGLYSLHTNAGGVIDWPLLGLALAAVLLPLAGGLVTARTALAWAMVWHAVLLAVTSQRFGNMTVWLPLVTLYAALLTSDLLDRVVVGSRRWWFITWQPRARRRWLGVGLLALLAVPGLGPQLNTPPPVEQHPSEANHRLLAELTEASDVVATDDPWTVAWFVDRPALWLPQTAEGLQAIEQMDPIEAIYFSRAMQLGRMAPDERAEWWSWAAAMPQGYRQYAPTGQSRLPMERILINREVPADAGADEPQP